MEKLPPHTREGLNTIGFLVNGMAVVSDSPDAMIVDNRYFEFRSKGINLKSPAKGIELYFELMDSSLAQKIYHLNDSSLRTEISEYFKCYLTEGCMPAIDDQYNGGGYVKLMDFDENCVGYTDSTHGTGTLNILYYDPVYHIISGSFEFTVSQPDCSVYEVTNGRFDLTFYKR